MNGDDIALNRFINGIDGCSVCKIAVHQNEHVLLLCIVNKSVCNAACSSSNNMELLVGTVSIRTLAEILCGAGLRCNLNAVKGDPIGCEGDFSVCILPIGGLVHAVAGKVSAGLADVNV